MSDDNDPMVTISFRIPASLLKIVDDLANDSQRSRTFTLVQLIKEQLTGTKEQLTGTKDNEQS